MKEFMEYQESIVDIIKAIATIRTLTPKELYVILEMSKYRNVLQVPKEIVWHRFDSDLFNTPDILSLTLVKDKENVKYYVLIPTG